MGGVADESGRTTAGIARWRYSRRGEFLLDRPRIIGILNVTPDSFFDGGKHADTASAVAAAERLVAEGADMIDLGGESTRPGSARVSAEEQARRVVPVVSAIRAGRGATASIPISVDTTRREVAVRALDAGADAVNDVSAGRDDAGMFQLTAERGAGLVLMHRLASPEDDQYSDRYRRAPAYADVVGEVAGFLRARAGAAVESGVHHGAILIDPGLGFGKSVGQNLELVRRSDELLGLGFPILSAASRKSFVGRISLGRDSSPGERLAGSLACSVAHWFRGARVFRVHDVAAHVQALRMAAEVWGLSEETERRSDEVKK